MTVAPWRLWILLPITFLFGDSAQNKVVDVLTNRYNIARTGANLHETVLNVNAVNAHDFGKTFEREVDGDVYAQPLIKTGVTIAGVGVRDVVYVATANNSLYAYDATLPDAAKPYWHVTPEVFGGAVEKSHVLDLPASEEYKNFETVIGITATPTIDEKTNTIYVVAQSRRGTRFYFRLHAFDISTGHEKVEPREIEATYNGNGIGAKDGKIYFEARKALNRPGLLLVVSACGQGLSQSARKKYARWNAQPLRRWREQGKCRRLATLPISGDANAGTPAGMIRAFDASKIEHEL